MPLGVQVNFSVSKLKFKIYKYESFKDWKFVAIEFLARWLWKCFKEF